MRQAEIRHRRVRRVDEVPSALELAAAAAGEDRRQVDRRVVVAVAHAGAVHHDRLIEQRAVAVGRVLHLLEEIAEQRHVIRVDLRRLRDLLGIELVVRHRVVAVGDADPRIRPSAQLARDLERDDAGDVGLEREEVQVEHQPGVVVELVRDADRLLDRGDRGGLRLPFRALNALFDVADGGQVLVDRRPVVAAEAPAQPRHVLDREVEDAAVLPHPREPLRRRAALAEHPLEHRARIALHRHRRRRRLPREGPLVDAAVAVLAAADDEVVVERQLQRVERRVLADDRRRHLVDRRARLDVGAFGLLRPDAAQPRGADARVHAAAFAQVLGALVREAADDDDVIAERFERLEHGRELEVRADALRVEVRQIGAVRRVEEARAAAPPSARCLRGERRHHRVEQRQRERRAHSSQEGPPGQCHLRDDHDAFLF